MNERCCSTLAASIFMMFWELVADPSMVARSMSQYILNPAAWRHKTSLFHCF
jgi:hypothetical protein